jgi:Tol biopolymer transport system component
MKRCPKCKQTYSDDSLNFCLDDGEWLVGDTGDGPPTAILSGDDTSSEPATRQQIHVTENAEGPPTSSAEYIVRGVRRNKAAFLIAILGVLALSGLGAWAYRYYSAPSGKEKITFQSAKYTRLTSSGKVAGAAISPDGKYVTYVLDEGGQQALWVRQTATSSNVQLVPPAEVVYSGATFSPDSNYVYYSLYEKDDRRGVLSQVPVLGGTSRKILSNINSAPAFAPDGRQIAFFRVHPTDPLEQLIVANADGSNDRVLAERRGDDEFFTGTFSTLSWSPDGKTIASPVRSYRENYMTVAAIDVESGEMKFITPQRWFLLRQTTWLADGSGVLVAAAEKSTSPFQIWQVAFPSGDVSKVSNDLNYYIGVGLTSNSDTMAVVNTERTANIWIAPVIDLSRTTQLTSGTGASQEHAWTPDGKLVYASDAGGNFDIYVTGIDGGEPRLLTSGSLTNQQPVVSPDGRHIIFMSDRTGPPHIWRMDIDGSGQTQLTHNAYNVRPAVSPDGKWVFFTSSLKEGWYVWKMPIDGGEPIQISDKFCDYPAVSPDSTQVACYYRPAANTSMKLAVFSVDGGPPLKIFELASPAIRESNLQWSPDGRSIVYGMTNKGVAELWAQPVVGGTPKSIANFGSERILWISYSRDGHHLAISRGKRSSDVVLISNFR